MTSRTAEDSNEHGSDKRSTDEQRRADKLRFARKRAARRERDQDDVDNASEGSFPASDPPPWTLG